MDIMSGGGAFDAVDGTKIGQKIASLVLGANARLCVKGKARASSVWGDEDSKCKRIAWHDKKDLRVCWGDPSGKFVES